MQSDVMIMGCRGVGRIAAAQRLVTTTSFFLVMGNTGGRWGTTDSERELKLPPLWSSFVGVALEEALLVLPAAAEPTVAVAVAGVVAAAVVPTV